MNLFKLIKPWSNSRYQNSVAEEYKLTEFELSAPLSVAETELNDWYNDRIAKQGELLAKESVILQRVEFEKRQPTVLEQEELNNSAEQRKKHELCSSEELTWLKLRARRGWQKELDDYRWSVNNDAFEEFSTPIRSSWSAGFNLPDMLREYEQTKTACTTLGIRQLARREQSYAQKMLLQLEQADSPLWLSFDPDKKLGKIRCTILGEVVGKLFTLFLEHITKDLVQESPATEVGNELPTAQQAESDQPETAADAEIEATSNEEAAFIWTSKKPVEIIDPRDASEELEAYLSEFSTAECDELAEAVGLNPPTPTQRKNRVLAYHPRKGAKTKIYAIADVLDDPDFDRIKPGQKIEFIKAFGRRLGFLSKKPESNAGSLSYKTASKEARKRLKTLIEERDKKK